MNKSDSLKILSTFLAIGAASESYQAQVQKYYFDTPERGPQHTSNKPNNRRSKNKAAKKARKRNRK